MGLGFDKVSIYLHMLLFVLFEVLIFFPFINILLFVMFNSFT
jgi:hypothetical protein